VGVWGGWGGVGGGGGGRGGGGGGGGVKNPHPHPTPLQRLVLHLVHGYKTQNGRVKPVCCEYKVTLGFQNKNMVYEVKINT